MKKSNHDPVLLVKFLSVLRCICVMVMQMA